jgi:hypothetical protein
MPATSVKQECSHDKDLTSVHPKDFNAETAPLHATNGNRRIRSTTPLILNLGARHRLSGQHHTLAALTPRMKPRTHSTGGFVGPASCLEGFGKGKIAYPYRNSNPGPSSQQKVATPNTLSRLPQINKNIQLGRFVVLERHNCAISSFSLFTVASSATGPTSNRVTESRNIILNLRNSGSHKEVTFPCRYDDFADPLL